MRIDGRPDLVIVGSGIAGGALATLAARAGLTVTLLERQTSYRDQVRGEYVPPWGVAEAAATGLLRHLEAGDGQVVRRNVPYDEVLSPEEAEGAAVPLDALVPGVPGGLDVSHPAACQALLEAAITAGVTAFRPVSEVIVTPGLRPRVSFTADGGTPVSLSPRLVVGADGRNSLVRRQIGVSLTTTAPGTFGWGLLVDGVAGWPADTASIGAEGDGLFFVFPRVGGRARLYVLNPPTDRQRFAGPDGAQRLLAAFTGRTSLPQADAFSEATPAGPCAGYPMCDSYTDKPYAPGAVLVGDAAGYNDPVIGQGLSIALRDAHVLADLLGATDDWSDGLLARYAAERSERMRRLRQVAHTFSRWRADFTAQGRRRRRAVFERLAADPPARLPVAASLVGPYALPEAAFTTESASRFMLET